MRVGQAAGSAATALAPKLLAEERILQAGEVAAAAAATDHHIGLLADRVELRLRLQTHHALVQQHVLNTLPSACAYRRGWRRPQRPR